MLKRVLVKFSKSLALILACSLGITLVLMAQDFKWLESMTYDLRMNLSQFSLNPFEDVESKSDHPIVLVAVDELTVDYLKEPSPLTISSYTKLLESMELYRPKAIGIAKDLEASLDLDRIDQAGQRFVNQVQRLESMGIPVILAQESLSLTQSGPKFPLTMVNHDILSFGLDAHPFSEDSVARKAVTHVYARPSFYLDLLERSGLLDPYSKLRGELVIGDNDAKEVYFRYSNRPDLLAQRHPTYSFAEVMEQTVTPSLLEGKVILVGTTYSKSAEDTVKTPFSKESAQTPKVYVHLSVLDSLLENTTFIRGPRLLDTALVFMVSFFVLLSVLSLSPLGGVIASSLVGLSIVFFSFFLFKSMGVWVRLAQPVLAVFLTYYLSVPYRLIQEYQSRWALERKSQILAQLEEMKTNFLRLVTHDLKTPVARIQGLAELLIQRRLRNLPIEDTEIEHLYTMTRSTDELNRFISRILDLTRIESHNVALNFESKDINILIETVVKRFRPLAESKRIHVGLELEPLFPISLDVNAITKVLANLVDNAIQYSPPDSAISIHSYETDAHVIVAIKDQGVGISKSDQAQLFSKFFRGKQTAQQTVSGSGLGLYLTKYFVDAHHGRVEVESQLGKGSTFKLMLPIEGIPSVGLAKNSKFSEKHSEDNQHSSSEGV